MGGEWVPIHVVARTLGMSDNALQWVISLRYVATRIVEGEECVTWKSVREAVHSLPPEDVRPWWRVFGS